MRQAERVAAVRRALLGWHRPEARGLPWRRRRDAYAIWVSEVMLQQTQVGTVIPYYERFLRRFGDIERLAGARLGEVLKLWEGLGYYSRARNLYRTAQQVVAEHGGRLPETVEALRALPGIGAYTAGAIASIAFGQDEAVLDGNVTRVLCRVFRITAPPKEVGTQKRLWRLARALLPSGKAGRFNEALMDLGATVCVPRGPRCEACPVGRWCESRARGEQERWPMRVKRAATPHYDIAAGVIYKGKRVLIDQRKEEGLLGGLWEFPGGKRQGGETLEACLVREVREELGIEISVGEALMTVKHGYSHFRITLHVFECRWVSGRPRALECAAWKWVRLGELEDYAFPRANQKVIERLLKRNE